LIYFYTVLIVVQTFLTGSIDISPREIFSVWYGSRWETVLSETRKYNPYIDQILEVQIPLRHSLTTYSKYRPPSSLFPNGVIGLNRNSVLKYDILWDFLPHELMHYQELCDLGATFLGWDSREKCDDVMLTEYNAYFKILAKKASDFLDEPYTKDPIIALLNVERYINGLKEKQEETRKTREWERTKRFQKQIEQATEIKTWYEEALKEEPERLAILMRSFV